ncbi:MAG TPA: BON domain-containing protein [Ramlibacter sp.]|nr:BON domain-containing protein [Ramlibacter sp.]
MNIRIENVVPALALGALLALAACGEQATGGTQDARSSGAAAAANPQGGPGASGMADDSRLTEQVKAGLAADQELSATSITVTSRDGVITLVGTVPTSAAKARADGIAKNVKDVKQVNNQLTVGTS